MKALVPDGFQPRGLPDDVELLGWDAPADGVVFAVPDGSVTGSRERLAELPDLEVVQVLSAGFDWVVEHVPDGVTLCNVGDTRSPAVAQWVLAAILADLIGFVVVLAPLSESTRGLVGAEVIARMKEGSLLVNAGRGPVVDTDALVAAVQAGRIRAALDVTDPEPLPEDHVLWTLDDVFITPHLAGDTPEAELAAQALARAQMLRHRAGLALHHVVSGPALHPRRT